MPEMDGFETLERIKADSGKQQIPVIIISGEDDMSSIVKCIEMGAIDYLNKPFDDAILTARVNACLTVNRFKEMEKSYFKLIHDERNKSDKLLLNILPKPISDRLKNGEKTIADFFPEVTVLFCDIVEFTRLSSIMEPDNIVMLLNKLFSMFDALVEKFDLEKIKTIGDAYMLVGGVPTPRSDHAEAVADMAIEMCESVRLFNRDNPEIPISVRIGIHSGPVIAGVIGIRKFSYDLWGDTVNTASRMESCGIVDKIHVSHDTYQILKKSYSFHPRGTIIIKGKGKMKTYLLENKLTPTS
ncbi:MAG: response regulator, partial [Desulfobulbaceae bacterium]|nr:response regulator [Desulfobulbaceae bacterium]